jgi:serine/threonine protein kinase
MYYFVFPWADGGDLQELWNRQGHKPVTLDRLLWSLRQILGLADAVRALHQEGIRHGDIKPQNILHFTDLKDSDPEGGGVLVLADVGISKHHHLATDLRKNATNTSSVTIRYEAPEAASEEANNKPRPRRYDMWSLGCMFLEYTVWFLYGFDAVDIFRCRRMSSQNPGDRSRESGNFFTQRTRTIKIHSKVSKAIGLIRSDARCPEGTALRDFVDVIERHLLQINPDHRAEAPELYDEIKKIVDAAVCDPDGAYLRTPFACSHTTPKFFLRSTGQRPASLSSASQSQDSSSSTGRSSSSDLSVGRSSTNSIASHGEAG